MKISISITNYSWPDGPGRLGARLGEVAAAADSCGIDTLWVADHLVQADPSADLGEPMLEAYTTLGYLAARTERIGIGTMVAWAGIRPASLLIKAVTTLDVLSGGRAWLGVGAGYNEREAAMMGLPFLPTRRRFDVLEETLDLAERMWSGDTAPFEGSQLSLEQPISVPAPLSKPRPRILVGGTGERRTLPLVVRYADACNLFDIPDGGETIRRKLGVLDELCRATGRNRDNIEITVSARLDPSETAQSLVERCATFAEWGIGHVVLITTGPWSTDAVRTVENALDDVAALAA